CRRGMPEGPQDTCIGICSAQRNADEGVDMSRFSAIKRYMTNVIVPSLKAGVKITYGEIGTDNFFNYTVCEKDIVQVFTGKNPITDEEFTYTWTIRKCDQDADRQAILEKLGDGEPHPSVLTPFYSSVKKIVDKAILDGATGEGTYMLVLSDGQPTDGVTDNMTGVCSGHKPFYKYVQERLPGTFVNLILLGRVGLGDLVRECSNTPSDKNWEFTNNADVSDLSTVMDRKFPVNMPELGAPMCAEYFKAHGISGYVYSE